MRSRRRHRVVIGRTAAHELSESLDYLEEHSSGAANRVLDEVDACIQRLRRFPESSPVDPWAPASLPFPEASGRSTHAAGFTIRYAFPVRIGDDARVVLIVSLRHGRRRPVDDPEYLKRLLAEIVRASAKGTDEQ